MNEKGHCENCKYSDDQGIQYAIWKPKDVGFLIDANEWSYIQNYFDNNIELPELEYDECNTALKIVYGTYTFQRDRDIQPLVDDVRKYKGGAHVTLTDNGWVLMELVDVRFFGEVLDNEIAIAALIRTTLDIPTYKNGDPAMTVFLRYSNLTPIDNILNRPGHFEIKDFENKEGVSVENWSDLINVNQVLNAHEYFWTCELEDNEG